MEQQFPAGDFDEWAARYDESVSSDVFPFEGYHEVLNTIVALASGNGPLAVLDLGAGTGNLSRVFDLMGWQVCGIDFSEKMLELARRKVPAAKFVRADIREMLPDQIQRRYDRIVSAYTFHHFPSEEKVSLVKKYITGQLAPHGVMLVGDIAFESRRDEDAVRQSLGEEWDQEYYWLADEALDAFSRAGITASFIKISSCAGVFRFTA
jgi:putative AdoMet-dependent methyltransferase